MHNLFEHHRKPKIALYLRYIDNSCTAAGNPKLNYF